MTTGGSTFSGTMTLSGSGGGERSCSLAADGLDTGGGGGGGRARSLAAGELDTVGGGGWRPRSLPASGLDTVGGGRGRTGRGGGAFLSTCTRGYGCDCIGVGTAGRIGTVLTEAAGE